MTQDNKEAKAEAFIDMIADNLPDVMTDDHVVRILTGLIASYADNMRDGTRFLTLTALALQSSTLADREEEPCSCPKCVADRGPVH